MPGSSKPKQSCLICKSEAHGIAIFPAFASKFMDERRAFIDALDA